MVRKMLVLLVLVVLFSGLSYAGDVVIVNVSIPNEKYTIGKLCSVDDPNFSGTLRYEEKIPYCNRVVGDVEKSKVGSEYGIDKKDWSKYEFDHLIPLSVGGSDDASNIWPQILSQSRIKDRIEDEAYLALKNGKITQKQAVTDILHWFCEPCKDIYGKDICISRGIKIIGLDPTSCTQFEDKYLHNLGFTSSDTTDKEFKIQDVGYEERPIPSKGYYYGAIVTTVYLPSDLDSLNFTGSTTLPNVSFSSTSLTTVTFSDGNFVINLGNGDYLINAKKDTKIIMK